jgi:hypothetical protein
MKKVLSFVLAIALAISLCVCAVEATPLMDESIAPMRASDYFSSYSVSATGGVEGDVAITISIRAKKTMDSIGATKIVIQEKDGSRWQEAYTKTGTIYNGLLDSDARGFRGSYTYSGTSGKTYRAIVTLYAEDAFGNDSKTVTTNSVVAK